MNYFVDTNIPIGYTIIHDNWHETSKDFINNHQQDDIFWSNLIKKEYNGKMNEVIDDVNIFLNHCKTLLKDNSQDFINYFDFENFLIKKTKTSSLDTVKKQKILEQFWNNYDYVEGISEIIYFKFIEFSHEFERQYIVRDKKLKKILILHDCGLDNYLKYLEYTMQLKEWGIHSPDCKIIADAHDCGIAHDDLIFISNDEKMLEIIANHDTSFLKIVEFTSCT